MTNRRDLLQECSQGNWLELCTEGRLVPSVMLLLSASVLGLILSAATFGARIPAGIILPSMTVGAALGRATGMLVQQWHRSFPEAWIFSSCTTIDDCVTPGVYAIIGASAALSGVTRMTVSLVVIMFELTGALTYVLPIMISVLISKSVADVFEKRGIYESWIALQGYPYLPKDEDLFQGHAIETMMQSAESLHLLESDAINRKGTIVSMLKTGASGFPIVNNETDRVLLGYVNASDVLRVFRETSHLPDDTVVTLTQSTMTLSNPIDLRKYIDNTPFVLAPSSSMSLVVNLFQRLGVRQVFLARRGRLCGMLTRDDLLQVLSQSPSYEAQVHTPGHIDRNVWKMARSTPRDLRSDF